MKGFLNPDKLFAMTPWKRKDVNVFLLLDCADEDGRVIQALGKWPRHEVIPLFIGTKDEENANIGPHLVKVDRGSLLLQWFLAEGAEYGIIFLSEAPSEVLGAHLQPFLESILPDDRRRMFRFYDPVSFYYFIPSLTPEELSLFMGPACGVACTRPICAEEGDSLFVEHSVPLELYVPPDKKIPWFVSEASYVAFTIPSEYSLVIILTNFFYDRYRIVAKLMGRRNVTYFTQWIVNKNRDVRLNTLNNLKIYLTNIVMLGVGYQQDPQFRHISGVIQNGETPEEFLQILTNETDKFSNTAIGDSGSFYYMALYRVLKTSYDTWYRLNFETEIASMLMELYPERAEYAGRQAVIDLVRIARKEIEKWALPPRPGVSLLAGLMFFLGVNCVIDPLHFWISKKLHEDISPFRKARDLFDLCQRLVKIMLRDKIV